MINVDKLASVLMRRCKCNRNEALSALSEAWLSADHSLSEPEVAAYLLSAGYYRYLDMVSPQTKSITELNKMEQYRKQVCGTLAESGIREWDGSVSGMLELVLPQPADTETDADYIIELAKEVPDEYRWPVIVVCHDLLSSRIQNRKPLTVETTRQLLKRRKIPNTSEIARQVYTFLTTRRPHA